MRRGGHPDDQADRRKRVLRRDDHQCRKCGGSRESLHVHHVRPISQGGSHDISNLEALCRSCHAKEHPTKVKLSSAVSDRRRVRMNYRSSSVTRVREPDPYAIETHDGIQYLVGRLLPKRDPGVQTEANRVVGRIGDVLRYTDEFRRYGVSGPKTATEKAIETKVGVGYRTNPAVDLRTITVRRWGYSRATTFDSMSRGKYVSVSVPSSVTSTVSEWR